MALKFGKKKDDSAVKKQDEQAPFEPDTDSGTKPKGPSANFLKTGTAAKEAMELEKKKAADRAKEVRRFWLEPDQEKRITFLSGNIVNGALDVPMWYEHLVNVPGGKTNLICVSENEICPLCKQKPSVLVAGFTVIDNSEFKAKNGKVYKDQVKILVSKPTTFKILQKLAAKEGGLVGLTFDVSRTSDKVANVGDMFTYVHELGRRSMDQLQKLYGGPDKVIAPIDFSNVLVYRTVKELEAEGFLAVGSVQDDMTDYSKEM